MRDRDAHPSQTPGKTQGIQPDKALERQDDKVTADILVKPKEIEQRNCVSRN